MLVKCCVEEWKSEAFSGILHPPCLAKPTTHNPLPQSTPQHHN